MIPKDLKIGDTFEDLTLSGPVVYKVVGFDGQGNYLSECIGRKGEPSLVPIDKYIEEDLPFAMPDDEIDEVQPVVEEAKKTTPKRTATKKKTTAKKTSKK